MLVDLCPAIIRQEVRGISSGQVGSKMQVGRATALRGTMEAPSLEKNGCCRKYQSQISSAYRTRSLQTHWRLQRTLRIPTLNIAHEVRQHWLYKVAR